MKIPDPLRDWLVAIGAFTVAVAVAGLIALSIVTVQDAIAKRRRRTNAEQSGQ
ncbi:hypothetical protein [Prauserella endophytica]|uniref:hypothetical protein n=1 Tax=Prauserella endophytica TaxID=1592324 RepID=UPI0013050C44|nr:hypothetical protein [Prauserella endophytica]